MADTGGETTGWFRHARLLLAALAVILASGCATNGGDPRDPFEGFNRAMYGFNNGFDDVIGKPVATAYRDILPSFVRTGVRNFFANIDDLFIGVNNVLQGKPVEAVSDFGRLAFNTTLGILGFFDVASSMGLEKHNEDFGQTFGRWGLEDGPYFVWPMFGSSTARDSLGLLFDWKVDPVWLHRPIDQRNVMFFTRVISRRADLLDASQILEEAALDKYVFQRDAYLQRRRSLIHDGNPPRERPSPGAERDPKEDLALPAQPVDAGNEPVVTTAAIANANDDEPPAQP